MHVQGSFRDREYLISAPQAIAGYSWEGVQTMEFTLSTDLTTANSFFLEILNCKDESKGLEWALLAVEVLNKSFQALEAGTKPELSGILQLMFKKPEFMHRWPAVVVYQDFRNQALKILNRRLSQQKACAGTTAMHLLISTLKLIIGCEFINRPTQLDKMKKNGVDWELGIQQVRTCHI